MSDSKENKRWSRIPLENLFELVVGGDWGIDPSDYLGNDYVDVICIRGSEFKNWIREKGKQAAIRKIKKSSLEKRRLKEGDILIEISGGGPDQPVGRTVYIDNETLSFRPEYDKVCSNFLRLVRLTDSVDKKYIEYYLQKFYLSNEVISYQGGSNNLRNLKFKEYSRIKIPLAPLNEQNKISKNLDDIFGYLNVLNSRLNEIPAMIKAFRERVLTQAITGKLTENWREENLTVQEFSLVEDSNMREPNQEIPSAWVWLPFNRVASIESNLVEPLQFMDYPLIAPDNIESKSGKLINKPLVSDIMPKSAKHFFKSGCIVYSKIRPYLSKLIIADFDGLCSADMYPIKTQLTLKYLYYYMLSETFLYYANSSGERSVLPKINQKELGIIPVPVPPVKEQDEIVRKVESLFLVTHILEDQLESLRLKTHALPISVLSKTFEREN